MTSHWMDRIAGLTTHIQARCSIQALGSPRTSIKLPDLSIYKLEPFIVQLRLRIGYLEEHQIFGVEYSFIMSDPHHIIVLITSKILGIRSDQSLRPPRHWKQNALIDDHWSCLMANSAMMLKEPNYTSERNAAKMPSPIDERKASKVQL